MISPSDRPRHLPGRRRLAVVLVVVAVLGGWFVLGRSGRATERYWNRVHRMHQQALNEPSSLPEAIDALRELEQDVNALSTAGVDQRAIDAAARLQAVAVALRRCLEHLQWMEDHPVRAAASALIGQEAIEKLRLRLLDLRQKSTESYAFAQQTHRELSRRYPGRSLAGPVPPDLAPIDELLLTIDSSADAGAQLSEWIPILLSLALAFFGG